MDDTYLYGNSGKDIVRSDWFRARDDSTINTGGDEYLFGDFKYGYGGELDKELWGDSDIIYGGFGDQMADQHIWAGDGDDLVHPGDNWKDQFVYGGYGDDQIYVPQQNANDLFIRGDEGDDVWFVDSYGDSSAATGNKNEIYFGGAGNDVIRGQHFNVDGGQEYFYGGAGEDKIYGGDAGASNGYLHVGGRGDDFIVGGDNWTEAATMASSPADVTFTIYGDGFNYDSGPGADYQNDNDEPATYGGNDLIMDNGDDVIYGGSGNYGNTLLVGGYGDDRIISGSDNQGEYLSVYGDLFMPNSNTSVEDYDEFGGQPNDGNDLIDLGENPELTGQQKAFGQGGNDKILGGVGTTQDLYGGDGDDKIWAVNPGQYQTMNEKSDIFGGEGNDIIYGSNKKENLYGDDTADDDTTGDDIIYTGVSVEAADGSYGYGGRGNDNIYGQGVGDDELVGGWGDDLIFGGEGEDDLWGDDRSEMDPDYQSMPSLDRLTTFGFGQASGDDTLYGGEGSDNIWAGAGNDYAHGGEGEDWIRGGGGEDTLFGNEGADYIWTGSGWDTVFGGPGCDSIYSQDGGDVIWGGDCEPADGLEDTDHQYYQWFNISGTGPDPENYTVIMDFWHESAISQNRLCLYADASQGIPGSGNCTIEANFGDASDSNDNLLLSCLTAVDV